MEPTLFLAKFWGWLLVIVSLIFLFRKKVLMEEIFRLAENKSSVLVYGFWSLLMGLATVIFHNVWVGEWRLLITIFGWLALIKSIIMLGFPEILQKIAQVLKKRTLLIQLFLVIIFILGGWLIWMSH